MNNVKIFVSVIVIVIVGVVVTAFMRSNITPPGPGKLDTFAQCLKDKGAVFYGAFWCSHCQAQKKLFGSSAKLLPYVECSTPDGRGQLPECKEKKVEGYPTWRFADGTELNGEVPLVDLAKKTSCVLPE